MTKKRDLLAELIEGFDALAEERQGKVTLRTHQADLKQLEPATAEEIVAVRKSWICPSPSSRSIFIRRRAR